MEPFTQPRVASAPAPRQGFARSVRRLEPPLTAARAPAQRAVSSCLTQLLRSFHHCSNTKFLIVPDLLALSGPLRRQQRITADYQTLAGIVGMGNLGQFGLIK